jgi:hypothetical protein
MLPMCLRGAQALVPESRRHADIEHGDVRAVRAQGREDLGLGARHGPDLVAGRGEQQDGPSRHRADSVRCGVARRCARRSRPHGSR